MKVETVYHNEKNFKFLNETLLPKMNVIQIFQEHHPDEDLNLKYSYVIFYEDKETAKG